MSDRLGPWQPLSLDAAAELFRPATFRWWVSGGHALELHLGRSWRTHDDTDISFRRDDAPLVRELLDGWDLHVAAAGVLTPWDGSPLLAEAHQNNVWARPSPNAPWMLDLTISEGDDDRWISRRDPTITRPWHLAILLAAPSDTPYLAPDLQLLFKSKNVRPKDDVDAAEVIPALTPTEQGFLADVIPRDHRWHGLIPTS